ncbi:MAG: hypothetical protein LUE63_09880 [Lachnospiraceae bacterium]|nr:hypothetical protein [Lachnospiraceae bacterium]
MAKIKWKRTKDGIQFIEKKTWAERLQSVTFMQAALSLFALAILLTVLCLAWAISSNGQAGWPVILAGFLILFLSAAGVGVTCYGHFSVEAESKIPWKVGLYTNGTVVVLMAAIYILGIIQ